VKIEFPMNLRTEALPDDSLKFAILYGPVVLAANLGKDNMPVIYTNNTYYNPPPAELLSNENMPEIKLSNKLSDDIQRYSNEKLQFLLKSNNKEFHLKPLYEIFDEKYHIYWKMMR